MECLACGHHNAEDARFCTRCGTSLADACPVCGHEVDAEDRFCGACGTALSPHPAVDTDLARYVPEQLLRKVQAGEAGAVRGERRTVTMLFADIQGSTAAAERLDPEEWADVVNPAFERLIAPVYRYEGTLARLQGDAVLAFFGAPVAHEDDPVRAVHAALDMRAALAAHAQDVRATTGLELSVRIGINTGLVVVGEVGSDQRVEYTALGDAINVAARMEQTAAPGTVRITERTAALLGDVFELADLGPVEVRGKVDAVRAYRVVGPVAAAAGGTTAPLVGRDAPLATLREVVARATAGEGGVATVVGDAGIGKSRLLAALRDEIRRARHVAVRAGEPGELAWLEGGSRSFDAAVPYATFLELGRRWFGWDEHGRRERYQRITASVRETMPGVVDDDVHLLAHLGGAELPPEAEALVAAMETPLLRERTTDAVVRYLEGLAVQRPTVLVLEDLHFADGLSLALVERLIGSTAHVPLALVVSLRPVTEDPAWRVVQVATTQAVDRTSSVQLRPLDPAATDELLRTLLGDRHLDDDRRSRVLDRAEGNPLFLEEIARAVAEGEGRDGAVPPSLEGLLSARLDRLDERTHAVATIAAVIGREFDLAALAALTEHDDVERAAQELVARGLLTERRRPTGPTFAFRHALLQEAAYGTVLLKERRALHTRLAEHLARTRPDAPHEVARHHLAGRTPGAALPWLVAEGRRAARAMALNDAIRAYRRAIDEAPPDADPEVVAAAHEGLGEAYAMIPDLDQASAAYQDLADFGRDCDLPALEARALNRLAMSVATIAGDIPAARAHLDRAREVAEAAGDDASMAEYHMNSCYLSAVVGDIDAAIEHDLETERLGVQLGAESIRAAGLIRRAMNLSYALRFTEAEELAADAAAVIDDLEGDADRLQRELRTDVLAGLRERRGDLAGAVEVLTPALEAYNRLGNFYTGMTGWKLGRVDARAGDLESALSHLGAALREALGRGQAFVIAAASAALAEVYATAGLPDSADEHRERALAALDEPLGHFTGTSVWADVGWSRLWSGDRTGASAAFEAGLRFSSITALWERPKLLTGAARVAVEEGDFVRAAALVDDARAITGEDGLRVDAPAVALAAALVADAAGDLAAADAELAAAADGAERHGLRLLGWEASSRRAELVARTGGEEAADVHRARAHDLAARIVAPIADPVLRTAVSSRLGLAPSAPAAPAAPTA